MSLSFAYNLRRSRYFENVVLDFALGNRPISKHKDNSFQTFSMQEYIIGQRGW